MTDPIKVDFGAKDRLATRAFARLMNIAEERERDILADPAKHLNDASAKILKLRANLLDMRYKIQTAVMTLSYGPPAEPVYQPVDVITVELARWQAFLEVEKMIEEALK